MIRCWADFILESLLEKNTLLFFKNPILSKETVIKSEIELRELARNALRRDDVLNWRLKIPSSRHGRVDALAELSLDGRRFVFEAEFKLSPTSREIERLVDRSAKYPRLLIAPFLSDALVQQCRERGLSCLDLNGRRWIRSKGLLVDRQPSKKERYRSPAPVPNIFQTKSSRLVRALLNHPERTWSQSELLERTGLSPGLVSRLVRHLVNEGYVTQNRRELRVSRADALLDAWVARDDWERRTTLRQYSVLETDLELVARNLLDRFRSGQTLVFTQWFAANLRNPYTTPPVVSAYVVQFPSDQITRELRAREVSSGGTIWLAVPKDDGVFRETQRVGPFTLACDAQIYLDLIHAGLRGPDQARVLREWPGFGREAK